ncbi:hypothetical protein CPAV1605_1255 [seawater metagenome]|uniref:Uncharacterized protein n=1 Tax=seawater metagenome TaxID=1561972 RepID=A0A5E8CL15_9ZZZZ
MEEEIKEYKQEAIIYKSNNVLVLCLFTVLIILFIILSVRELLRIYKYSRWIGPFPNVSRSPPISYQLDNYLDDIYMGLAQLKYIPQ